MALTRGGMPKERTFVVRSSPDPARIHRVEPDPFLKRGREHLVAYLGTMGPQDGVELLLQAARHILDMRPGQVRFIVMGGGNQRASLQQLARDMGLTEDDLAFPGRVPDDEVRRTLSTADVAVSPDPANDFNEHSTMNKTLEYMATGLPVVAFDLEETRVSAGDAAVYARPNDPAALAELVLELLDDPERRARMGAIGRERMAGPLSWERSAEQLLAAYEAAVAVRRA
jgi:glycosyltransferase involved in cell wall biosynthesis